MPNAQFRVLYREFLFRMVDLELLAPQGDITKLLGQFAALLAFISSVLALGALFFDGRKMSPERLLVTLWGTEHFLIATTMLVVGLFAVLSWDSMFPDRRDVLVLAPLPICARTLFLAKVAAVATALSLTVVSLHAFAGITWPFHFGGLRSLPAYWITMLAAGAFIFCSVLTVQGLAGLLPRRQFLRVSGFLQMAAFCLFVSVYCLAPPAAWLPSRWFFGLFHILNGSATPAHVQLARRALTGLTVASLGAGTAFLLSYFRTLRKIVEEPDILPGSRGIAWSPRFGGSLQTALVLFSVRTLFRSRQHRVVLAFYSGIAFAIMILFLKTPVAHEPWLFSTIVVMCLWVIGTRVAFALPLALRANWIFRVTEVRPAPEYLAAIRRPLFVLAVAPVWLASALLLLSIWPWRLATGHLVVLGLWGMFLAYLCLHGFHKIPFTCSYLPGKSNIYAACLLSIGALRLVSDCVEYERRALEQPASYVKILVVLAIAVICARWRTVALAKSEETGLQFDEAEEAEIISLDLL
jgi:hypothetical protein